MTTAERTAHQIDNQAQAVSAYVVKMRAIEEQLEAIGNALKDRVSPDDVTWGHVGDLGHVRNELADLVAFLLGGTPDSQIR